MLKSDFPLMASEPEAFVGRLADVAPEYDKERFLFRMFLASDGPEKLKTGSEDLQSSILRLCMELQQQLGLDREDMAGVCLAYLHGIGKPVSRESVYRTLKKENGRTNEQPIDQMDPSTLEVYKQQILTDKVKDGEEEKEHEKELEHAYGRGMTCLRLQRPKQGFSYFQQAAKGGHLEAQFALGECYRAGWGTPKDPKQAESWYGKAAARGHVGAGIALVDLQDKKRPVDRETREKFCAWDKNAIHIKELNSILPRFNHLTYDAQHLRGAVFYLLLMLHGLIELTFISEMHGVPPIERLFLMNTSSYEQLTSLSAVNEFLGFTFYAAVVALGIFFCLRLPKEERDVFRAISSPALLLCDRICKVLAVIVLVLFSLFNPGTCNWWKTVFEVNRFGSVFYYIADVYKKIGLIDSSGVPYNIYCTLLHIPILFVLGTGVLAMQVSQMRIFDRILKRYWLFPTIRKKHSARLILFTAALVYGYMAYAVGGLIPLALTILLLILPRHWYIV
ncbi:MAG: sel1 repeat family protein [Clostridia bacterium]|nr:sel1 repeat family protein [Clostridia bacterium]